MTPSEFTIYYNIYLIFYQLLIFKKISKFKKLCYKKNRLLWNISIFLGIIRKKIEKGENMLADYHIHCKYSDDSEEKPEKIIKI